MAGPSDIKVKVGINITEFNKGLKKLEGRMKQTFRKMESIGSGIQNSITLPVIALGGVAVQSAIKLDQLKKGLIGIMGSAEMANKEFERLRVLAKDPGMSLQSVVEGSIKLQAIGYDAEKAAKQMKILGNAIALVGGGGEALSGVTLAMTQILGKGKVHAEEINQMAERLPQIRKAMQDAFGTADTEKIQKMGIAAEDFIDGIIGKLGELPKAQMTLADQFQHLKDDLMVLGAQLGMMIIPLIMKVANAVMGLIRVWSNLSKETQNWILGLTLALAAGGPVIKAIGLLGKSIMGIVGKFSTTKLIIGGILVAGYWIYKNWDDIKQKIVDTNVEFADFLNKHDILRGTWENIKAGAKGAYSTAKMMIQTLGNYTIYAGGNRTKQMEAVLNSYKDDLSDIQMKKLKNTIEGYDLDEVKKETEEKLKSFEDFVSGMADNVQEVMKKLFSVFSGGGAGGGVSASSNVMGYWESIGENITKTFNKVKNRIGGGVEGLGSLSIGSILPPTDQLEDQLKTFETKIEGFGKRVQAKMFPPKVKNTFEEVFASMYNNGVKFSDMTLQQFEALADGIRNLFNQLSDTVNAFYDNKIEKVEQSYEAEKKRINQGAYNEEQKASMLEALDARTDKKRRKLVREQAIANKAAAIFNSIINGFQAVTSALTVPPPAGPALAAIVGGLATAATAAIAAQPIPSLASGGIAKGESIVRVGEYPGAGFKNPEVISPLNKLKDMIGGQMGNLTVNLTGGWKVSGYDLETVLEGARVQKQRLTA